MKKILILMTALIVLVLTSHGQVHQIVFNHTPPPIPVVDAGSDTILNYGASMVLNAQVTGGTPPFSYLWQPGTYLDDSTVLNPTFTWPYAVLPPELLTLTVWDENGCIVTDQVTIYGATNSIEEAETSTMHIYPNPTKGVLYIASPALTGKPVSVSLYSVTGSLMLQSTYAHSNEGVLEVDLRPIRAGFYLLEVEHNGHKQMQKIIVQ